MTELSSIAPRKRVAKGPKRPSYLVHQELDKFMMMFTSLMGEVSVLRERIDTHEVLAAQGVVATREAVEAYEITEEVQAERSGERDAMMNRVFRILLEDLEMARDALSTRELEEVMIDDGFELPVEERTAI